MVTMTIYILFGLGLALLVASFFLGFIWLGIRSNLNIKTKQQLRWLFGGGGVSGSVLGTAAIVAATGYWLLQPVTVTSAVPMTYETANIFAVAEAVPTEGALNVVSSVFQNGTTAGVDVVADENNAAVDLVLSAPTLQPEVGELQPTLTPTPTPTATATATPTALPTSTPVQQQTTSQVQPAVTPTQPTVSVQAFVAPTFAPPVSVDANAQVLGARYVSAENVSSISHIPGYVAGQLIVPSLGVNQRIEPIKLLKRQWDLYNLGKIVGWLPTTGMTPEDQYAMVFAAHFTDYDGLPGSFHGLADLPIGTQFIYQWQGVDYVYQIERFETAHPAEIERLYVADSSLAILITCANYNPATGAYDNRTLAYGRLIGTSATNAN